MYVHELAYRDLFLNNNSLKIAALSKTVRQLKVNSKYI